MEQRDEYNEQGQRQKVMQHKGQWLESRWMSDSRMEKNLANMPGLPMYTLGYRNPEMTSEFKGLLVRTVHGEYIFRQKEVTIKVKSAVKSIHKEDPRTTVGLTEDRKTIVFFSKHYDQHGNVFGPYEVLTEDVQGMHLAGSTAQKGYTTDSGKQLQKELLEKIKKFISNHK